MTGLVMIAGFALPAQSEEPKQGSSAATNGQVKDPVCGMMISQKTATGTARYKGTTYYFCSRDEKEKFEKSPETYVKR